MCEKDKTKCSFYLTWTDVHIWLHDVLLLHSVTKWKLNISFCSSFSIISTDNTEHFTDFLRTPFFFSIMSMEKEICHTTLQKAGALLIRCQTEIQTWMARNKIYLNPTNPVLLIGTRHHYSWVSFPGLSSDSVWSHEITLDSQFFPCKGLCCCLFPFSAINNNERNKSWTFASKCRKLKSGGLLSLVICCTSASGMRRRRPVLREVVSLPG